MPDFDDDDFFINDDELDADHQLTLLDEAKIDLLKRIIEVATETIENIKFNEFVNTTSNISSLLTMTNGLTALHDAEDNLSDFEMEELIEKVFKSNTEITFSNIDAIIPEPEVSVQNDDNATDDDGTDF